MRSTHEIADLITRLAKAKGVSVNGALIDSGAGMALVNNLKKGQVPSAYRLKLVADFFGVTVDYLLVDEESTGADSTLDKITCVVPLKLGVTLGNLTQKELDEVAQFAQFIEMRRKNQDE